MADDLKLSLKKITFEKDGEFFLYSRYEIGKGFRINLFNVKNCEAYDGDISEINLRAVAATRRTTYTDFLASTVCALMWDDSSETLFSYSFEKGVEDTYFRWAKVFKSEDMKVNLGRIKVCRVEFCSVIETVLCQVSLELRTISLSLEKTKLELEESNKERERSKDLIQSAIKVKEDMEKELYSKFVLVLNKKKEKIRKLKGEVAASSESADDNEVVNAKATKRTKKMPRKGQSKRVHPHLQSTSEEEEDSEFTDEDLVSRPGPSTCHQPTHNSSLFLEDDFETSCPVQQPRQRRPKGSRTRGAVFTQEIENKDDSSSSVERTKQNRTAGDSIEDLLDML